MNLVYKNKFDILSMIRGGILALFLSGRRQAVLKIVYSK